MTGAQPAPSTTWRSAFPQWDLVADQVPVSGDTPVAETSPEDRVETILEIASAFRGASDAALGELYPLIPAQFGLVLDAGQQPVTFATLAIRPSADVTTPLSRADGRRLHRTLAQVNAAAGAVSDPSWPRDPVLRAVSSAVFALAPERFYALIDIRLKGGDVEAANDYVSREFQDDLSTILDAAITEARQAAASPEMQHWLDTLVSPDGGDALSTHPQLRRPLGLLDVTLAQAAALLVPEVGDLTGDDAPSDDKPGHTADVTPATRDAAVPETPLAGEHSDASPPPHTAPVESEPGADESGTRDQDEADGTGAVEGRPGIGLTSDDGLDAWENALRRRLTNATLAIDSDLSALELDVLLDVYGDRFRLSRGRGTTVAQIAHHFPAATLMSMVGMASVGLEDNAYWDRFWERLCTERNHTDENALRQLIIPLLQRFDLDPIKGLSKSRHVQRLAVHAGIPASSASRVVEVLTTYIGSVSSRDTQPFSDWVRQPGQEHVFEQLDYPTRDFVRYSGERGSEILDEMTRIVAEIAENPAVDAATLTTTQTFLPELLIEPLREALHHADVSDSVRSQRRRTRLSPTLHLEADDSMVVRIPAPSSHTSAPWTITLDTHVVRVAAEKFSSDRSVEVPVEHPTRRIVVTHPSLAHPIELRLYDAAKPLILFTTQGEHIPDTARLPRSEVLAVMPGDLTVVGEHPHAPRVIADFGTPLGWDGWTINQWDLTETTSLRTRTAQDEVRDHRVGSQALPSLFDEPDDPLPVLPGVFSEKLPVLHSRPWLSLPALGADSAATWSVQYRRAGAREWVVQGDYAAPDAGEVPLFDEEPEQLGRFDVRVTGPFGARFETSIFVAEGLKVEYDDPLRIPEDDGLTEVTAEAWSDDPALVILDPQLHFGPQISKRSLRLRRGAASEMLTVRPPRMEFRMTPVGGVPSWSDRQIGRRPDDFTGAVLAVRGVPEDVPVVAEVRDHTGSVRAKEQLVSRSRAGVLTLTADRLAGAAREAQSGLVILRLTYPDGTYPAPIIRFNTVGADVRITVDGDEVRVRGRHLHSDTTIHIWKIARPWSPVLTVPLVRGRAALPASALEAGDLRIAPVVQDDWDPVPPSPFPTRDSVRIGRPGAFTDSKTAALSQFLLGEGGPDGIDPTRPEVWSALALLSRGLEDADDERFDQLSRLIGNTPRRAALSLAAASLDTADKLALFIRSGLVFHSFRPYGREDLLARAKSAALSSEPWLDVLITIADIPAASVEDRMALRDRLRGVGGHALVEMLKTGSDPLAISASLDAELVLRSDHPDAVSAFLDAKRLVPGGLTDAAARYEAYRDLFRNKDSETDKLREFYGVLLEGRFPPLSEVRRFRMLWRAVKARTLKLGNVTNRHPWANAPFASLTFCLYARLAAVDEIRLDPPPGLDTAWAWFAAREPEQTMIDLLVAEALVTHMTLPDRKRNPYSAFDSMTDEDIVDLIVTT
ncbi:hypothetical protein [Dietzia cinnamea]|uniref:hypothetical protein n=1 Tax=Dietzia cinnamea TaxID=321318 RepID=UPI00223ADDB8|nr:hypothetical protein [Dietzia cinnamea]MCT2061310.1 hypothetical protein [Dietzia cinnamea]MCT2236492.1 hypothetical protein [Dietzia cinnamea]MCT2300698.1 hypothetical protein [Dietzia cinnamea]